MSAPIPRADAAAQSVGASDVFVLRRVSGNRFVHLGGAGRGAGWAGLIEVTSDEEKPLRQALEARRAVRLGHGGRELVFGPYYAHAAAFVPVTNDVVVVFGSPDRELDGPDEQLTSAAHLAADAVDGVTEAKRLADELEELEAVRAALQIDTRTLEEAMEAHVQVAKEALSCEVGAVYLADGDHVCVDERGWALDVDAGDVRHALRRVLEEGRFPTCVQDASIVPLPAPLDRAAGIRSYYALELTGPARGVLLVAHTDAAPRGFTLLCRRLGLRLAEVASAQLSLAVTRDWCSRAAARLHAEFGKLDAP